MIVRLRALCHSLAVAVGCVLLAGSAAPRAELVLRAQAWTAADESLVQDLTEAPRECLARQSVEIEVGRSLFRSPGTLGGPAARAGLSCHACHTNGRVNRSFFLPELTDRAGAADASSEWASKVRGDGLMNPRDIPDLAGVGDRPELGQARDPSLAHFVSGVVVDEFQGQRLPDEAFGALIAYLRALRADACAGPVQITLADTAGDVRRALNAAVVSGPQTASLLLFAAQDGIGRIVERLPRRRFGAERRRLEMLARELGSVRSSANAPEALTAVLPGWMARFDATAASLARREDATYFNERALGDALNE